MIELVVHGEAKPAGALAIGTRKDGGHYLRHRASKPLGEWKGAIAQAAGSERAGSPVYRGAVSVSATFFLLRPAGHYGKRGLRSSALAFPIKRSVGDVDKLTRACLDALSGVVFADDSQVVDLHIRKRYADDGPARAEITIRWMDELDVLFEHNRQEEVA